MMFNPKRLLVVSAVVLATFTNAQTKSGDGTGYENRPVVNVGIRELMDAVDQASSSELQAMAARLAKHANPRSIDFHSFTIAEGGIVAWLWPRQCKTLAEIADLSTALMIDGRYAPLSMDSPAAYVEFKGLNCITAIEVKFTPRSTRWEVRDSRGSALNWQQIQSLFDRDYKERAISVKNLDDALTQRTLKGKYPIRWMYFDRSTYGGSRIRISFDTRRKCLNVAEIENRGYEIVRAWPGLINNKHISVIGDERLVNLMDVALDPDRPQCIRTMATPT